MDSSVLDSEALGMRVFCATKARDRSQLGEVITEWIQSHPQVELVDKVVLQSSDAEFHCLTIVLLFRAR